MKQQGIKMHYKVRYVAQSVEFWRSIGLPGGVDRTYHLSGVKPSNHFMKKEMLSEKGPGGGGWILINEYLQVVGRNNKVWGDKTVYAVGDCNMGYVLKEGGDDSNFVIPHVPKMGYPAEQQAIHVSRSIKALDTLWYHGQGHCCCLPVPQACAQKRPFATWYPWGAGIYAISLGPQDGLFISDGSEQKGSGKVRHRGMFAAAQKELIETTKVAQCQRSHCFSQVLWYTIHHWPVNFWGRGPLFGGMC